MYVTYPTENYDELNDAVSLINYISDLYGLDAEINIEINDDEAYEACVVNCGAGLYELIISPSLLDPSRSIELLTTVAHEMIHVKQYELGELVGDTSTQTWTYKGVKHDWSGGVPRSVYYSAPWEVEAYGLEKAMYEMWLENKENIEKISEIMQKSC